MTDLIGVKPAPAVSEIGLLRTPTAPIMKSALVVEIVALAVRELPVLVLGVATSKGDAVFAPLTAKATTEDVEDPLRFIVIVIAPIDAFVTQKACRVRDPDIATLAPL